MKSTFFFFFGSLALSGYLHYLFVLFPKKGFRVPVGYNAVRTRPNKGVGEGKNAFTSRKPNPLSGHIADSRVLAVSNVVYLIGYTFMYRADEGTCIFQVYGNAKLEGKFSKYVITYKRRNEV